MINPNAQVRIFIADELITSTVKTFDNAKDAFAAMRERSVLKVDVDGYGPMIPDEFISYCIELGLDSN